MVCRSSAVRRISRISSLQRDMPCWACHWVRLRGSWFRNWSLGKRLRWIYLHLGLRDSESHATIVTMPVSGKETGFLISKCHENILVTLMGVKGALTGMDTSTRGTYYFDAFESRRQTYIGP